MSLLFSSDSGSALLIHQLVAKDLCIIAPITQGVPGNLSFHSVLKLLDIHRYYYQISHNFRESGEIKYVYECIAYLLIKLIDNALCPLKMKIFVLQWPVNISKLDTHLADQKPVILVGPVNT